MMLLCALLVLALILLAFLACYVADRVDAACPHSFDHES